MRAIVLLRGINLGSANRVPMGDLRSVLADAGLEGVRTYVQSGNVVADWDGDADSLAARVHELIAEHYGLDLDVVVRSVEELEAVIDRNPFPKEARAEPKLLQVTFLDAPSDPERVATAVAQASRGELAEASGRELYTWHPHGIARSKLALGLVRIAPSGAATSRNWRTVTRLLEMAREEPA